MLVSITTAMCANVSTLGIDCPFWIRDMDDDVTLAMCASAFCSVVPASLYSRSRNVAWLMSCAMAMCAPMAKCVALRMQARLRLHDYPPKG